jgi:hypothetical protein
MTSSTPFAHANIETMDLIALIAALQAAPDPAKFDVLTRRLSNEDFPLADSLRIKIIDNLMKNAPQFAVRRLKDIVPVSKITLKTHLIVVIDTSGSMAGCIRGVQQNIKAWVLAQLAGGKYSGVSIIFFDNRAYGPFNDVSCLDIIHGNGGTYATTALTALRNELTIKGLSDIIFMTDGEFSDKSTVYNIVQLPNVAKFSMIFPQHTPYGAEADHYAYLPRITLPNTPVFAERATSVEVIASICDRTSSAASLVPIKETLYKPICGEYAILKGMSLFQLNNLINRVLDGTNAEIVQTFFSHIMGMYNLMMNRSGDLLNTLRSEEMKLLWQFMQPLKKRLKEIPDESIHTTTAQLVLEFLVSYEDEVVKKRDKRLDELRRIGGLDATRERDMLLQAFQNMKKVDEKDRIDDAIDQLAKKHKCVAVRFNYIAQIPVDIFRCYPNIDATQIDEIYKMVASIGVCAFSDEDAIKLPLDPNYKGLGLLLQQLTFRKKDEVHMTLSATHAFRILCGFFVTQIATDSPYKFTNDHIQIRNMIVGLVTSKYSHAILTNVTNMQEEANNSPAWIRILHGLSRLQINNRPTIFMPEYKAPVNKTIWREVKGGFVLNNILLGLMCDRGLALALCRYIYGFGGSEMSTRVVTNYPIKIPDFKSLIVVKTERVQTMEEWRDTVVTTRVLQNTNVTISITNGMLLQETIHQDVDVFLAKYWESGHRMINKSGSAHPASTFGDTTYVRPVFDKWIRTAWADFVEQMGLTTKSSLPIVPTTTLRDELASWLDKRTGTRPLFYSRDHIVQISIADVIYTLISHIKSSNNEVGNTTADPSFSQTLFSNDILSIALQMAMIEGFGRMTGDEQTKIMATVTPATLPPTIDLPNEVLEKIKIFIPKIIERFSVRSTVTGEGKSYPLKIKTDREIDDIGKALSNAEDPLSGFDEADFIDPLGYEIFVDPVSFGGHLYERAQIEQWLAIDVRRSSPLTRQTHNSDGSALQILPPPASFVTALALFRTKKGL